MTELIYNGYTFGDYTHIKVDATMVPDSANRTITHHRYLVDVTTIIVAEGSDAHVGDHFLRIRRLLSKAGAPLYINHEGFGPALHINAGSGGPQDVAFGPMPKIIRWDPVGATNAVEVVWQVEFHLPTCDGVSGVRYTGISALNYSIHTRVSKSGHTIRTVSGFIEIAMRRVGQQILDTADAYREVIIIPKPPNFERETTWTLSEDKRRAEFSITDTEIASPNAYPFGVIAINATHSVDWSRRDLSKLRNTIRADIQLAVNQPISWAWEIFKAICNTRFAFAQTGTYIFIEGLSVREELFQHRVSFEVVYRIQTSSTTGALAEFFNSTGIGSRYNADWQSWEASTAPFQSHRGIADMRHNPADDQIIDLCTNAFLPSPPATERVPYTPPSGYVRFCNPKPDPDKSWSKFEAYLQVEEYNPASLQITIGEDDLDEGDFDPNNPEATLGQTSSGSTVKRFLEEVPAGTEFVWSGYAERVGYRIPRPRKLQVQGIELVRKGRSYFRQKILGVVFCQPVYGATWRQKYAVKDRPTKLEHDDIDEFPAEGS